MSVRLQQTKSLIMLFLAIVLIVTAVYATAWLTSRGSRGQFSPQTLELRTRSQLLLPLTRITIYASSWHYSKYELCEYLIKEGFWVPNPTDDPQWILSFHWNQWWRDGQTKFHTEFGFRGEQWIDWSRANGALAAHLWPKMLEAMRSGDDTAIHEMLGRMMIARGFKTVEEYESHFGIAENAGTIGTK